MKTMNPTPALPTAFDQRLKRVKTEVQHRIAAQPANRHNAERARLWCRWIKKAVLAKPATDKPFDCDLYPPRSQNHFMEVA